MISAPEARRGQNNVFSGLVGATIALLLLSGCGANQVIVEGNFPAPVMTKLPLSIGIWYPEEFRNHEFSDVDKTVKESKWIVKTGDAQVQMWNTVLAGMFRNFVEMDAAPGPGVMNQVVDAILIPHVDELQYAIPTHTHVKIYEIWLRYRFELVTRTGKPIAEWTMTAYGKTPTAFMQSDTNAVNLAAVMALRDAGANFVTSFTRVPELAEWRDTKWPKTKGAPP